MESDEASYPPSSPPILEAATMRLRVEIGSVACQFACQRIDCFRQVVAEIPLRRMEVLGAPVSDHPMTCIPERIQQRVLVERAEVWALWACHRQLR